MEAIAARFDVTVKRVYGIANHYSVARFERVDVPRTARRMSDPDFWNNVVKGDGCWEWTGPRDMSGYGTFHGKRAHRLTLAESLGRRLAWDEMACHRCDNPPCVRPDHLFVGSAMDNVKDMWRKGRANHRRPDGVTPI